MSDQIFEKNATALLMKYHHFVFRQACLNIPFPDLAEDVAQQTFVDFLAKADQWKFWESGNDPRPLLKTMVRHRAQTAWRERAKLLPEALQQIALYVQQELNEDDAEADERLSALQKCMQKLPENGRRLITRYYFDGIPTKQIAEELQKKTDTVGKAIYRVQEKLRLCIEQTLKAKEHHG